MSAEANASNAGTLTLGGDLTVNRLGIGSNRITHNEASETVLREAVARGVNFIDTADRYGNFTSESAIRDTLAPYDGIVVATKGGLGDNWMPISTPTHLQEALEGSLKRLGVERIDVYYLHAFAPDVPVADSVGTLSRLRDEGKIRHVALSNASVAQLEEARTIVPIVAVQNRYNPIDRSSDDVLAYCEAEGIAFVPYSPLGFGDLGAATGVLAEIAARYDAEPLQIALAWLLKRSPVMLPIPGTLSVDHLKSNLAAAEINLSDDDYNTLLNL
jgi:pyridoxine 4-dehydrogenase